MSTPPLTTRRSRSDRVIKASPRFDDSPHSSFHAYTTSTFSLDHDNNLNNTLQPDLAAQSEPHPLALMCGIFFGLHSADPDTMHLHEALHLLSTL